ncbi:MAG: ABC transporter permease [Cyclobacteriaceae bacterium]
MKSLPAWAERLLRAICPDELYEQIEGDLIEIYNYEAKTVGKRKARLRFILACFRFFRPGIVLRNKFSMSLNNTDMLNNYIKIGVRNLLRNKGYSLINIVGLTLGMAVAIMIGLWVFDELSFNKSFRNWKRVARVQHHISFGDDVFTHDGVPAPFGKELKNSYADFEEVVTASEPADHVVGYDDHNFSKSCRFVEPEFIKVFSIPLLQGNSNALKDIQSVLLSKSFADALIGDEALGTIVKFDNRDNVIVAGIFEDFPANSKFHETAVLLPMDYYFTLSESTLRQKDNWDDFSFQCYVLVKNENSFHEIEQKIKDVAFQKTSEQGKLLKPEGLLFPMEKWYLYSNFKNGKNIGGKIQFVWIFGIVGVFVLFLACINFMNLSTARGEKRSKEIGIRKVMGSVRSQLANQFMIESFLVVAISFLLSIMTVTLCLPWLNDLVGKQMVIPWSNGSFLLILFAFALVTSLLAGSYPAFYLSSFNSIKVLKGTFKEGRFASVPRNLMVIFQFSISTILIVGALVIFQQIEYAKDRPIGFDREGIIFIDIRTQNLAKANYNSIRHELLSTGVVENMAKSDYSITGDATGEASISWPGKDPSVEPPLIALNGCSHDFPKTTGFQFIEGRDFDRNLASDSSAIIVNEMAAKLFSDESAIGKKIKFGSGAEKEIIGVIKNQVRWTPFENQTPHIYYNDYSEEGCITIRLNPESDVHTALSKIETVFKKYDPGAPFDYKFVDEDYARLFKDEERIGKLTSVFTVLAVFISCIGMFGLASFAASQRRKEFGIRKVLGATMRQIAQIHIGYFIRLVVLANIISFPIAYWLINGWLEHFAYRIDVTIIPFVVVIGVTIALVLISAGHLSWKAGRMNPVDVIKGD